MKKAQAYLDDPQRFFEALDEALPVVIRAMAVADEAVKSAIVMLLGGGAGEAVQWPLFHIMSDAGQTEETRHHAAIQLGEILSTLNDTEAIATRLEQDLRHPDPIVRRNAAVAFGWEGNTRAAAVLAGLIGQGDPEIQTEALTALANLNTDDAFALIKAFYETGGTDQQRVILYNLWRLTRQEDGVFDLVKSALIHQDDGIRLDAMIVFCSLADPECHYDVYLACLKDPVAAVRELSLGQLERLARERRQSARAHIAALTEDPDPAVRVMARRFLIASAPPLRDDGAK